MLAARLSLPLLLLLVLVSCAEPRRLNVVIISLDTTRADRLGAYGYDRGTSPAFDALAEDSVLFDRAYTQSVVTSPSHLSMMTGLRPHSHGALFNGERITTELPGLAQRLGEQGYRTGGFVSAIVLSPGLSDVSRGFERFDADFPHYRRGAPTTTDAALSWLHSLQPDEPYFLFVHYYDAHGPFRASPERLAEFRRDVPPRPVEVPTYQRIPDGAGGFHDDVEYYSDLYDASIREQDDSLERLLRSIDRDRSIVVVLADHGESFDERYVKVNHGTYTFNEQARIPLLIRVPGLAPRRVQSLVETTDLAPTLLDWLGSPATESLDGHSLVEAMKTGESSPRETAVTIAGATGDSYGDRGYQLDPRFPIASMVVEGTPNWKLIRYPDANGPVHELYRLDSDPLEQADIASSETALREELIARLESELPGLSEQQRASLGDDLKIQLEALGYVE